MKIILPAFVLLMALCVGARGQLFETTFNPPETQLALKYGTATLAELPAELKVCYWTAGNWSLPPTTQQVQQVAQLQISGGDNPQTLTHEGPQYEPAYIPRGSPVLLNCEGWTDAQIKDCVGRYKAAVGSGKLWTIYAPGFYFTQTPATQWIAENQYNWTRDMELRRGQIKSIVDQMPAVLVEAYPFDPLDTWIKSWDFQVANLRRLYPNKKLGVITRGFKPVPGGDGSAGPFVKLPPDEQIKMASWVRSRFDFTIVWGWRSMNIDYARQLVHPPGWDAVIR